MRLITLHPPEWPSSESLQSVLERACKTGAPPAGLGTQIANSLCGTSMEVSWKPKDADMLWSSIPTLGRTSRSKSGWKRYVHPAFFAALFPGAKTQKQPKMSPELWKEKEDVVHIFKGMSLSHPKVWHHAIFGSKEGPRHDDSTWNNSEEPNII